MANPKGNPQNLTQFSKDNPPPANRGRKKSKLKTFIQENDRGAADVRLVLKNVILDRDEAELKKLLTNKKNEVILKHENT